MTSKEYLRQYEIADRRAKRIRKEYETQEIMIDAIRSTSNISGMPKQKSGGHRTSEEKILRLADKRLQLIEAELKAVEVRQEVFDLVIKVPGDEGAVLYARYVELKSFERIAVDMNYSYRHIHRIHGRALHLVDQIMMS